MGLLELTEVDPCVAKPQVGKIIFLRRFNIGLALDVKPLGRFNQERILKVIQIFFDGIGGNL